MATNFSPGFHSGMPPEGDPAAYGLISGFSANAGAMASAATIKAAKILMDPPLTFDDVDRQTAARRFLVLGLHVRARLAHGLDDLVERDVVRAVAAQRHARDVDGFGRADRISFNAGDLHEAADRIAGESEVVLHGDFRRVLDLAHRTAEHRGERRGRHRAGHAHLALAADLGAGDRGVL